MWDTCAPTLLASFGSSRLGIMFQITKLTFHFCPLIPMNEYGALTITVTAIADCDPPCMEVKLSVPHIAHAVASGPHSAVDSTNVGSAFVNIDASKFHTLS
jgi:hypothetical protein